MLRGVFICYRRKETAFAARTIYDRIAQKMGRGNVFLDVGNTDPGVDCFDASNERLAACDGLIGGRAAASPKDDGEAARLYKLAAEGNAGQA